MTMIRQKIYSWQKPYEGSNSCQKNTYDEWSKKRLSLKVVNVHKTAQKRRKKEKKEKGRRCEILYMLMQQLTRISYLLSCVVVLIN